MIYFIILFLNLINFTHANNCVAIANDYDHLKEIIKEYLLTKHNYSNIKLTNFSYLKNADNICVTKIEHYHNLAFKVFINNNNHENILIGKFDYEIDIPILNKNINKGEVISNNDLGITTLDASKIIHKNIYNNFNEIMGQEARYALKMNQFLSHRDLVQPLLIKKNSTVSIIYSSNNLKLKLQALALSNGYKDEVIPVKNLRSQAVLHGKVKASNLVEIEN